MSTPPFRPAGGNNGEVDLRLFNSECNGERNTTEHLIRRDKDFGSSQSIWEIYNEQC